MRFIFNYYIYLFNYLSIYLDTATRSFIYCFISFYISRYDFSQIIKTSFSIIWKKDFHHKFSFFNRFTQTLSAPFNGQNLLSGTNVFCWCSLTSASSKVMSIWKLAQIIQLLPTPHPPIWWLPSFGFLKRKENSISKKFLCEIS